MGGRSVRRLATDSSTELFGGAFVMHWWLRRCRALICCCMFLCGQAPASHASKVSFLLEMCRTCLAELDRMMHLQESGMQACITCRVDAAMMMQ